MLALFSDMVVLVDAPNVDPPEIEHPNVLPLLLLEDAHDSEHFTTKHKFATRNDLLEWVGEKARKLGFSTVIGKSDNGGNGRSTFVTLICERGGSYTEYKRKSRREIAGSVKCECPFRLRGYLLTGGDWSLKVGDGKHNHDMTDVLKGHKTVGRLNPNERVHLEEMVDSNVPPRQMLTNLKKRNRTTSTTIKHVYNASYRYRRSIRGTRNDMQHLLKSLVDNGYVYHCRKYPDSKVISDVFWAHLDSIKLFNTFSTVLVLNSTYKTNKYRLPLLEFVGNTSTMKTFSIDFAYMMSERQDNVYWALKRCREMLHTKDLYPKVFATNRDNALINVVEKVFPKAITLLCSYHIGQNVRAKCKLNCKVTDLKDKNWQAIKPGSVVKTVMDAWMDIVDSETEEAYIDNWNRFKVLCAKFPKFLEYVEKTILDPVKEKFMRFKGKMLWSNLIRNISREALHHLVVEYNKALEIGTDKSKCGCLSLITYGLPCACMNDLKIKNGTTLCLEEIHTHWNRLRFEYEVDPKLTKKEDVSLLPEWEILQARFKDADYNMKLHLKEQFRQFVLLETTSMRPLPNKGTTKGAPKKDKQSIRSTRRSPLLWEIVDSQEQETQGSHTR
uniref:Ovarian tumour, otubain, related n=1 Tax=Medicago truncatula TaxID=3880 RepID=A2Q1D6_MEDTR|nr:Ovarian tumour, otubain, related [Medicago truncatula]